MRLSGRIILYGEYLMHAWTRGLVMPSHLTLATSDETDEPLHIDYDSGMDSIAHAVRERGMIPEPQIRGSLPFCWGLATSTVLTMLHTRGLPTDESLRLAQIFDTAIHGFPPSGVDAAAVLHQCSGLFSFEGWEPVALAPVRYTLLLFPKEGQRSLVDVRARLMADPKPLVSIADQLTDSIRAEEQLDYALHLQYARTLLNYRVYAPVVASFVAEMLARGISTKATGGLYDRAVIVLWPDDTSPTDEDRALIASYSPLRTYDFLFPAPAPPFARVE